MSKDNQYLASVALPKELHFTPMWLSWERMNQLLSCLLLQTICNQLAVYSYGGPRRQTGVQVVQHPNWRTLITFALKSHLLGHIVLKSYSMTGHLSVYFRGSNGAFHKSILYGTTGQ